MQQETELEPLIGLGLTLRQAKTYTTLVALQEASIQTIAKTSKIARPNLYGTLDELQRLGIVVKIISNPIKYRAIPIKTAIPTLMKIKTQNHLQVMLESKRFLENYKEWQDTSLPFEEKYILLSSPDDLARRIYCAYRNVKSQIRSTGNAKMFGDWDNIAWKTLEKANSNGVDWKLLVQEGDFNEKLLEPILKRKKVTVILGLVPNLLSLNFCIFDNSELFFGTGPQLRKDSRNRQFLWTNCQELISLTNFYFELTWQSCKQIKIADGKIDKGNFTN
jgi:sugar-specific transcriptional regulator TrmB